VIGITLGEYFGIGPEIVLKTYAELGNKFPPCKIYGSLQLLRKKANELQIPNFLDNKNYEIVETYQDRVAKGDTKSRAEYVLSTLNQAIEDALKNEISSIVTCPLDKSVVQRLLPSFTGHTEYLEQKSGASKTIMLLNNKEFSIALMSNHVPLRNVSALLYSANLEEIIRTSVRSFSQHFHISDPKIAILGVNPHAGELDRNSEEKELFVPLIEKLKINGFDIHGPFPADSFFPKARNEKWDLVFSPFHDQGLVAAKYNGLENVINVTLGMPFLRISPGHGVAYDIADQNIADHRSFRRALLAAQKHSLDV
jgi:4-hydroxythreonine-4-phosphate dehydrogenase